MNWSTAVLVIFISLLAGCNKNQGTLPKVGENTQEKASPASEEPDKAAQAERKNYLRATRQEIDQLRNEIDALAVKAKNSSADLKTRLEKQIPGFEEDLKIIEKIGKR
ncbi:MAG TPA: hypothetical protein VL051_02905 [Burkholderiaceae bacterium]|nr:hypothetical protein [Burkholderiaceae bacterium]